MIAAVLDRDVATPASARRAGKGRGGSLGHDVADSNPPARRRQDARQRLPGVADHEVDLAHGGERFGIDLSGAAGDDEARGRPLAARLADRLARLAHSLGGHRAGVEDDGIGKAVGGGALGE